MPIKEKFTPIPKTGQQNKDVLALAQNVELMMGARGNTLDSVVTWRDFIDLGFASQIGAGNFSPQIPDLIKIETPQIPTGTSVVASLSYALVTWDLPTFDGYAYTEVWRSATDDFSSAVRVGTSNSGIYADRIDYTDPHYYWIRHVNTKGEPGPINATAGMKLTPADRPEEILSELSNKITESELYGELNSRIDQIDEQGGVLDRLIQVNSFTNSLGARYTVKIDDNGHVAGYGLATTLNEYDGSVHSTMLFSVDTFAVASPGAQSLSFVIDEGRVVMDAAHIVNLTVTNAQIGDVAADKITGFDAAFVNLRLGSGWVTNQYIGDFIQSNNYIAGVQGWRIDKSGYGEFHNITARGNIVANSVETNSITTKHIKGGAVSSMEHGSRAGISIASGEQVFATGMSCSIPSGESGNVLISASFSGLAVGSSTNFGVVIYGVANGNSYVLGTLDQSVRKGYTESGSTSTVWRNAPAGAAIHVYARNNWSSGAIQNGLVSVNTLTTLR